MEAFVTQNAVGDALQRQADLCRRANVACCATSNVADLASPGTVDGHTVAVGDRVLLTAQSTATENGLWVAGTGTALARPADAKVGSTVTEGTQVFVENGSANGDKFFQLSADVTVGTSAQTWAAFTAESAGAGDPQTTIVLDSGVNDNAATPPLSFDGDANTGIYRTTADSLGITAGGSLMLSVKGPSNSTTVESGQLLIRDGTSGAPGIAFDSAPAVGIYGGASELAMKMGGTTFSLNGTSASLNSGALLLPNGSDSEPALAFNSDPNSGLYYISPDKFALVANGSAMITLDEGSNAVTITGGLFVRDPLSSLEAATKNYVDVTTAPATLTAAIIGTYASSSVSTSVNRNIINASIPTTVTSGSGGNLDIQTTSHDTLTFGTLTTGGNLTLTAGETDDASATLPNGNHKFNYIRLPVGKKFQIHVRLTLKQSSSATAVTSGMHMAFYDDASIASPVPSNESENFGGVATYVSSYVYHEGENNNGFGTHDLCCFYDTTTAAADLVIFVNIGHSSSPSTLPVVASYGASHISIVQVI